MNDVNSLTDDPRLAGQTFAYLASGKAKILSGKFVNANENVSHPFVLPTRCLSCCQVVEVVAELEASGEERVKEEGWYLQRVKML